MRTFTIIIDLNNKIEVGYPKNSITKEWQTFFKTESTYWAARPKV